MERFSQERIEAYKIFLNSLHERRNANLSPFCRYALAFSIGLNAGCWEAHWVLEIIF